MAAITLKGTPCHTCGDLPAVGSDAPDFRLVNADMQDVTLAGQSGRRTILSIVPSLETPVCAISTQKFDQHAAERSDIDVLVVSADLPFAQNRFCTNDGLAHVKAVSTMRSQDFARNYGVLIVDGPLEGLCARAVVVLDAEGKVLYSQLVSEIADEPDYQAALAVLD